MILDNNNLFANAIALNTVDTNLHNVGDVIDLGNIRDIGRGRPTIYLVILVQQAITSGGGASVQFSLVSDSQNPPRTDGTSENIHYQSQQLAKATLVAGYELIVPLPLESPVYAQYVGIQAQAITNILTAGIITAGLTLNPNAFKAYPSAVNA